MIQTYKELLEKAVKKIPKAEHRERFVIPNAQVISQGARTIISNFSEITNLLRREKGHILKFLLKELATSYEEKDKRIILTGRFNEDLINKKIELYVKNYVICPACNKPDTKIIKQDRIMFLKCEVCGAKHAIKKIK